jgi:hypothetical protein
MTDRLLEIPDAMALPRQYPLSAQADQVAAIASPLIQILNI